ncbi:MAG: hypothetical protein WAS21_24880 [Geminicoccaceae bacterium]
MRKEELDNPGPLLSISLACDVVDKKHALEYFNRATHAFREALGDRRPYGSKADEICEATTGLITLELRGIRDSLNRKFGGRDFRI